MSILGIKLVTGEEIYGKTEITTEGRIKVSDPVILRMIPSQLQGGQPSMAFVPFPQMMDENRRQIFIEPLHIVYQFVPYAELISEYTQLVEGKQGTAQIITG